MKNTFYAASMLAAMLVQPAARAAAPLQDALISATYNGAADAVLGLDHLYAQDADSNVTHIDAADTLANPEFITADYLFAIDISTAGVVTLYNNAPIPGGAYAFKFDFGASVSSAISGFTLLDGSQVSGAPRFTVLDGHTVGIDLGSVTWLPAPGGGVNYASVSGQLAFAGSAPAPVPEPQSALMLAAGLALVAGAAGKSGPACRARALSGYQA